MLPECLPALVGAPRTADHEVAAEQERPLQPGVERGSFGREPIALGRVERFSHAIAETHETLGGNLDGVGATRPELMSDGLPQGGHRVIDPIRLAAHWRLASSP